MWPRDLDLKLAPVLVRELAGHSLGLEQERIVLDPRMPDALVSRGRSGSPTAVHKTGALPSHFFHGLLGSYHMCRNVSER